MATTVDFIEYVCDQIRGIGELRYKKMFGEYMVYMDEKPILLVCDNTVYVKMLDEVKEYMKNAEIGEPYPGAKPQYILDIDDREYACQVVKCLEHIVPVRVPKKKKPKSEA